MFIFFESDTKMWPDITLAVLHTSSCISKNNLTDSEKGNSAIILHLYLNFTKYDYTVNSLKVPVK